MEFEDSPAITEKDRVQANAPRVNLQPVHSDVHLRELPQFTRLSQEQGHGRAFEFETENTATEAARAMESNLTHHHLAVITAGIVCAVFISGIILLQLNR